MKRIALICFTLAILAVGLFGQTAVGNALGTAGGNNNSYQYNCGTALCGANTVYTTASGAISVVSQIDSLGGSAAQAMTLASPSVGNDGVTIIVIATTAHAHTITCSSNAINGSKHLVTFANQGDYVILKAVGGVWYVVGTSATIT